MKKKDDNLLDYIPHRSEKLKWSQDEDEIVTLHRENTGVFNRLSQRLFYKPAVTHIRLEAYGSFLWRHMDGERSVGEIAALLKERFGEAVEPLYPRVGQYCRILQNNRFIRLKKA